MQVWADMPRQERVATLQKLALEEGHTASYAAELLKTTRSAILGAAHRFKIQFGEGSRNAWRKPFAEQAEQKPRPKRAKPKKEAPVVRHEPDFRPEPVPPSSFKDAWKPLPGSRPRPLHECSNSECSWPVSAEGEPRLFCGEANTDKSVYCEAHTKRSIGRR